jgi:hypothetical protein
MCKGESVEIEKYRENPEFVSIETKLRELHEQETELWSQLLAKFPLPVTEGYVLMGSGHLATYFKSGSYNEI